MLTQSKVQEVITLLGQGLPRNEIANTVGISRMSVYRIERGIHRNRRLERCDECGDTVFPPCRRCAYKAPQARSSVPLLPPSGTDSLSVLGLELEEEHRRRYEAMRRKVEAEIHAGTRTWDSAHPNNDRRRT